MLIDDTLSWLRWCSNSETTDSIWSVAYSAGHLDMGKLEGVAEYLDRLGFSGDAVRLKREIKPFEQAVEDLFATSSEDNRTRLATFQHSTSCLIRLVNELKGLVVTPQGRRRGNGTGPTKRGPKGPQYNVKEDKRIYDGWKTSGEKRIEDYARKKCEADTPAKIRAVRLAIDREKKRRKRKGLR